MVQVNVEIFGSREMRKAFEQLKEGAQRRIGKQAVQKGMVPVRKAVRDRTPKETGALKKSMGSVVRNYPRKGIAQAYIGPRVSAKYERPDPRVPGRMRKPWMYGHVLERRGKHKGFMRAGWDATRAARKAAIAKALREGIKKEAAKAAAKALKKAGMA